MPDERVVHPASGSARIRVATFVASATLALIVDATQPSLARVPAAVVDACASERLPADILDGAAPAHRGADLPLVAATAPGASLVLAVAADEAARERGLMCVLHLRPQHGMVFAFPRESEWEFWMKNTLVPLDMVWVDASGTVTTVAADVPASTRATPETALARRRGRGIYVVELRAGEAAADGLAPGAHLSLPTLRSDR